MRLALIIIIYFYYSISVSIDLCDTPSPPSNGYIDSYNRTAGGLAVNFACTNRTTCTCICPDDSQDVTVVLHTAICTFDGRWQPNLEEFCSRQSNVIMISVTLVFKPAIY